MEPTATSSSQSNWKPIIIIGLLIVSVVCGIFLDRMAGIVLFLTVCVYWWAYERSAIQSALVGSIKGMIFLVLVGPLTIWLMDNRPITDFLIYAIVSGWIMGSFLGVRNARFKKKVETGTMEA